jgi:ribosomal protein S18 acetylase RimI-like enzyme
MQIKSLSKKEDIKEVAQIAHQCFRGYASAKDAFKWISCNFNAYPRAQYFIAKEKGKIIGYILWLEKGGFRKEAVWELEQIAVLQDYRGRGVGTRLIVDSLALIKDYLKKRGSVLKVIEVTTGAGNEAQKLYRKTLGVKKEATIKNFFRGDEIIMLARY